MKIILRLKKSGRFVMVYNVFEIPQSISEIFRNNIKKGFHGEVC